MGLTKEDNEEADAIIEVRNQLQQISGMSLYLSDFKNTERNEYPMFVKVFVYNHY